MPGFYGFRIKLVSRESTLDSNINWLEYLTSPDFVDDLKERYESKKNAQHLRRVAYDVITEEVYSKHSNPDRTDRARDSMKVVSTGKKTANLNVISDPSVAPVKSGKLKGSPRHSYLAFFEKPEFQSFLPPEDNPYDILKHRPFMAQLTDSVRRETERMALDALVKQVRRRMPRKGN